MWALIKQVAFTSLELKSGGLGWLLSAEGSEEQHSTWLHGPSTNQPARMWFQVQVIPWVLADSNFVRSPSQRLDPSKTVFVGALHGMLNAEALAAVMYDLFGGVVYAGIDTDKHKYPIGKCWSPRIAHDVL